MTDVRKFELFYERYQLLMIAGISLGVIGLVGQELVAFWEAGKTWDLTASGVTVFGWMCFMFALIRLRYLRHNLGQKGDLLTGVIDDERVQANRSNAYSFGLTAALVWQLCIIVGVPFMAKVSDFELTAVLAANVTLGVAIVASIGRFLYLERV